MSEDLNLSGPEKFLKSIGTTLDEVGTWLKGIGLSIFGSSEPTGVEPKPVTGEEAPQKAKAEENEQEQGEAEGQEQAEEKIKAEEKAKAEEEVKALEKAQAEEKLRAQVEQITKEVESALVEVGKVVDSIVGTSLKDPAVLKLEELKKRQTAATDQKDLTLQEKDFNTLLGDIGKFKGEADTAKKESDETQATRLRVETSKKQIELDLAAFKKVVDGMVEVPLRQPGTVALDKLTKGLEVALKHAKPEEQENALTELGKQMAQDRLAADKAAKESETVVEQRKRVAELKDKTEKELAGLDNLVKSTASGLRLGKLKKVKEDFEKTDKLTDLAKQELEFPERGKEIAALKLDCESFLQTRGKYEQAYNTIKAEVEKAVLAADGNPRLPSTVTKAFRDIHAEVLDAVSKLTFVRAKKKLTTLKQAADALNKAAADGDNFYKELAKIDADYQEALAEIGLGKPACTDDEIANFQNEGGRMDQAIEDADWVEAEAALADLTIAIADIQQARLDLDSFDNAFGAIESEWDEAKKLINGAGVPDAFASAFAQADAKVDKKYDAKDWAAAESRLPALKAATDDVLAAGQREASPSRLGRRG